MKILLIKQSSLGDLIHCFPAISDLHRSVKNVQIDWLVEQAFVDVPKWHKGVNQSIPISIREWRRAKRKSLPALKEFIKSMKQREYDLIIDAQALIKSALAAKFINNKAKNQRAKIIGLDRASLRTEKIATLFYHKKISVPLQMHAIERVRRLFAAACNYEYEPIANEALFPTDDLLFPNENIECTDGLSNYIVGIHSTTWESKHLPTIWWKDMAQKLQQQKIKLVLPWYSEADLERAKNIQQGFSNTVIIAPKLNLNQMASLFQSALGSICVDTGFAHISAAMGIPTIALYGSTNKELTAALGEKSTNLQSTFHCAPCMRQRCQYEPEPTTENNSHPYFPPCYKELNAELVWQELCKNDNITNK